MLRLSMLASLAAVIAVLNLGSVAAAHDDGILCQSDSADVVSVAEPVYYAPAPVQSNYVTYQPQYVPVSDTIVTPYGYTPVYNNGYYQGYNYSPQYAFNPYYAAAAYGGNNDPVTTAVVSAVVSAAASGGNVNASSVLQSLIAGFLASQSQAQYAPGYGPPVYQQPVYQQPVYPQTVYQQPAYYAPRVVRVYRERVVPVPVQAAPVEYVPAYVHDRGWHRGWRESEGRGPGWHEDGPHGHGHGPGHHGDRD